MLVPCPWCGPRDAAEFRYVGEVAARPEPLATTPSAWRAYLYLRQNRAGWTAERWYHRMGCRRYIAVERDTVTNQVRVVTEESAG